MVFVWTGETEVFEYDDVILKIQSFPRVLYWLQRMLYRESQRIYLALAYSCGRANTIWKRYVWTRIFLYLDTCGQGLNVHSARTRRNYLYKNACKDSKGRTRQKLQFYPLENRSIPYHRHDDNSVYNLG